MPRFGVSFEEVALAAENILSKGENPTIEKVRLALGSRGSNSTISKYMSEWRSQSLPNKLAESSSSLPNTPDPVNRAVSAVWEQLQLEKKTEIEQIKEETQDKIKSLTVTNEDLQKNLEEIVNKCDELGTINSELKEELTQFKNRYHEESKQHTITQNKLEESYNSKKEIEKVFEKNLAATKSHFEEAIAAIQENYKSQISELNSEIDKLKEQAENYRHQAIVTIDDLKTKNAEKESKITMLEQEKTKLASDISNIKQTLESTKEDYMGRLEKSEQDKLAIREQSQQIGEMLKVTKTEISSINTKIDKFTPKENNYSDNFNILNQKIMELSKNIDLLNNSNKAKD